jgi:hypothetical protein
MVTTTETIVREDPYTEAYKRGLFQSVFDLVNQQMGFETVDTGRTDEAGNPILESRKLLILKQGKLLARRMLQRIKWLEERLTSSKLETYFRKTLALTCPIYKGALARFKEAKVFLSKRLN